MLRIAVCDDEKKYLNQTAALLDTYFRSRPSLNGQMETFRSGSALLARAEEAGGFDVYVLDILMPELRVIGRTTLDSALTGGRVEIQNKVTELLQNILDSYQVGIQVV